MILTNTKRSRGQFFTVKNNPFELTGFQEWATEAQLSHKHVLEPFAGANHIIRSLQGLGLCNEYTSFDIEPADRKVRYRNTIASFPTGFDVCVTNPPWLARNSATRRKLSYPTCEYDDIYKYCLELCLKHCEFVAALIPASYLQSGLFQDRLSTYILLHSHLFTDTENPVCLALFTGITNPVTKVYYDNQYIGELEHLRSHVPRTLIARTLQFNDPNGQLGFVSFDNTKGRSIRFCEVKEIESYQIKHSSRFITRIAGEFGDVPSLIQKLNRSLTTFRDNTHDLFLTPFKGIREDGQYRRRMFFSQARDLINTVSLQPHQFLSGTN